MLVISKLKFMLVAALCAYPNRTLKRLDCVTVHDR